MQPSSVMEGEVTIHSYMHCMQTYTPVTPTCTLTLTVLLLLMTMYLPGTFADQSTASPTAERLV